MEYSEKLIISAAVKPALGFVDVLLNPKKEKLKNWIAKKEVNSKIKSDILSLMMSEFLDKSVAKVSRLSTLVFPQQKIHISDIYEPIAFSVFNYDYKKYLNLYSSNEAIDFFIKDGGSIKVLDGAGVGKSTFLKNLTLTLCSGGLKIPVFFEFSAYNYNLSLIENLTNCFSIDSYLFDINIFLKMLEDGWFVIILDGFDEIQRDSQRKIGNEIQYLSENKGKSTLILSSRPQDYIPSLFSETIIKLSKLNKDQARNILKKYDDISLHKIYLRMEKELGRVPVRFLEIPLLVGLLYRTYAYNNSIADSIAVFYSELYEALYKGHDLTKHGLVREKKSELDIDAFRKVLRVISFKFIFSNNEKRLDDSAFLNLVNEAIDFVNKKPKSACDFFVDIQEAVPLIFKEGLSYKFMHRTIPEYFSAEFINNQNKSADLLRKIFEKDNWRSFSQVLDFFYEINPNIYNKTITFQYASKFIENFSYNKNELLSTFLSMFDLDFCYWRYDELISFYEDRGDDFDEHDLDLPNFCVNDHLDGYDVMFRSEFEIYGVKYIYSVGRKNYKDLPSPVIKELAVSFFNQYVDEVNFNMFVVENFIEKEIIELNNSSLGGKTNFKNFNDFIFKLINDVQVNKAYVISHDKCVNIINKIKELDSLEENLNNLLS